MTDMPLSAYKYNKDRICYRQYSYVRYAFVSLYTVPVCIIKIGCVVGSIPMIDMPLSVYKYNRDRMCYRQYSYDRYAFVSL